MEPWEIPAGYSCEELPSRTFESHLLLRKEEIMPNIWPEIPQHLSFWRKLACQTLPKALDISSATAQVAPDLLNALAILSDRTVKRSAVYLQFIEILFTSFSGERRPFSWRPFPNILK